jgi:DNA-binding CsgD family transcriptional regulator/5-methylcytosine-specific restriction endonuclease McrA
MFVMTTRDSVAGLHAKGLTVAEVAARLGLADNTVRYHLSRPVPADEEPPEPYAAHDARLAAASTREHVAALLISGLNRAEIARELGVSKATVSYHARRLGAPIDERCNRRYDWPMIQRYYDQGHSVRNCQLAFGFSRKTWFDAVARGAVRARPRAMPIEELLDGRPRHRKHLKKRLLDAGLLEARCRQCGLTDWRGTPLTLALHHVNGDRHDNRLDNLELLCPNCHSQTENFAGRNRVRGNAA